MARRSMQVEGKLVVDEKSFAAGIRKAVADTNRLSNATKRANRTGFSGLAKSALKAAAATASLYTVYDQGKKAVNATKDLAKGTIQLTRTTGLSTRESSRFVAVAKVRGVETQKLATSFTILSKQIVAAQGGSEKATEAFRKLGVSQEAIKKGDTREVFLNAADGLSKMANGANKTALAAQLFGRGYQALFPLLDMGSKGIAEQLQLAGDLGAELSGNSVEAFKKYAQAERTAQLAILGFRIQVGNYLIPKLTEAIGVFQEWVKQFRRGEGPIARARDAVVDLYGAFKPLIKLLLDHPKLVAGAMAAYLVLKATILGLNLYTALMTAIGPVSLYSISGAIRGTSFGAAFGTAMSAGVLIGIVALPVIVATALERAGAVFQQWATRNMAPEIKKALGFDTDLNPLNDFKDQFERIKESAKVTAQYLKDIFGGGGGDLLAANPFGSFDQWFDWLKNAGKDALEFLRKLFGGGGTKNILGTIRAPNISGLSNLVGKVKTAISNAVKTVSSAAGRIASAAGTLAASAASGFARRAGRIASAASGAISSAVGAVKGKVGSMVSAGASLAQGVASGIRNSVGSVLSAAADLAASIPSKFKKLLGIDSPSKVFTAFGEDLVAGLARGLSQSEPAVKAAAVLARKVKKAARPSPSAPYRGFERDMIRRGLSAPANTFAPGIGGELADQDELLRLQYNAQNVRKVSVRNKRGKALKRARKENERRQKAADNALSAAENRQQLAQNRRQAAQTIRDFAQSLKERIEQVKFDQIMAPVLASRSERAARQFREASGALSSRIGRASGEINSPQAQARYTRERTRLNARIQQAERQGNLELLDDLYAQREALDSRYTSKYVNDLRDQLSELNENEIERTAETQAKAFANTFAGGITEAVDAFLSGGSVQAFFSRLTTALAGSGVTPGSVDSDGLGSAIGVIGGTTSSGSTATPSRVPWRQQIEAWLRSRRPGSYNASSIAKDLGTSKSNVWANKPSIRGYRIKNRVSGGALGAMTLVGETGPELIVGNKVISGTRTSRLGGGAGMNITINATGAVADSPQLLARELGWQLSTR